ncbi:MAG: alpha/beta fold hydrolase, partial [Burkholderiales bacterium]
MNTPSLPAALSGKRFEFDSIAGRISCYVDGSGPPLMLVHSVNAAASAAEIRPLHEHYRQTHTVFSLDLPGYGFSERTDRAYTPRLMTNALHAMVSQIQGHCGAAPVDALA